MRSPHSRHAIQNVPDEQEIIRWGDQQQFVLPAAGTSLTPNQQLVKVHRNVPETWNIVLFAFAVGTQPVVGPAYNLIVVFDQFIGTGASQVNMRSQIILNSALGAVTQDYSTLSTPHATGWLRNDFPARDIQVAVSQVVNIGGAGNVLVAAFAAPRYTPYVEDVEGEHGHVHMPEGFYPEGMVRR